LKEAGQNKAVTVRALILAGLLTPVSITWQLVVEQGIAGVGQAIFSLLSLFFNCLFILLGLVWLNNLLARRWPQKALHRGELLVIYVLLTGVTAMCGGGIVEQLVIFVAYPAYRAQWISVAAQSVAALFPQWLIVSDGRAASSFWVGEAGFFSGGYWRGWTVPVLSWTLLLGIVVFGLMCLSVLVRQQWADRERLTFPVIQLPLQLVSESSLFRGPLFWSGVGAAIIVAAVNGLHQLFPSMPALPTRSLALRFPTSPWNAVGDIHLYFYPYAVGMGFLSPLHLSFATWFFVLFQYGELVLTRQFGLDVTPRAPFLPEQSTGALLGLILLRLALQRRYLYAIAARALGRAFDVSDEGEPVSYRLALLGLLAALICMTGLCLKMGIGIAAAMLFIGLYFLQSLGVARVRAELGPPAHDIWGSDISMMIINSLGTHGFSSRTLVGLHLLRSFSLSSGDHPMPSQLEGLQMAKRLQISGKGLFWSLLAFMILGTAVSIVIFASLECYFGAATPSGASWFLGEPGLVWWARIAFWEPIANQLSFGHRPENGATAALFCGAAFAVFLSLLSVRFTSWPFHPIGFVIAQSWYVVTFVWASIFFAWLMKALILRYGGRTSYARALPLFYGLMVGDCLAGVGWSSVGMAWRIPSYSVWS